MRKACEGIRPLLALAAGGELSPEDQERVAAHLPGCTGCRSQVAELSSVIEISRTMMAVDGQLPSAVRQRIVAAAAERAGRPAWSLRLPILALLERPGLVAAAAVLVV